MAYTLLNDLSKKLTFSKIQKEKKKRKKLNKIQLNSFYLQQNICKRTSKIQINTKHVYGFDKRIHCLWFSQVNTFLYQASNPEY